MHFRSTEQFVCLTTLLGFCCALVSYVQGCTGVEAILTQANKALQEGNLVQAEKRVAELQVADPNCRKILLLRGRIAAARGETQAAIDLWTRYKTEAPLDPESYYRLGELYLSEKNYQSADVMSELAVIFGPDHLPALVLRGKIMTMKGQLAQAEELLKKACGLAPENAEAHFELGVIFDTEKKNSEAVDQFLKVIELNPRNPQAYDYLALNLEPLGRIDQAEAAYRKALQVNAGTLFDSFLDYNFGRLLMKQNRLEEAGRHLNRAVQLAPRTRAVYYERGKLNLKLEKYDDARLDLEKALELPDPSGVILDLQIYYLLSQTYARLGREELARKYTALSRKAAVPIRARERR